MTGDKPTAPNEHLRVSAVSKLFVTRSLTRGVETTAALSDVSLSVPRGSCVGIVGESGSGKSTLVRCILGLEKPTSGEIWFEGERIDGAQRTRAHRGQIQPVFQNPVSSLNPRRRVGDIIAEPMAVHTSLSRDERRSEVQRLLGIVGLPPGFADRFPSQLSGGQCQRVSIARALALKPRLIVADEATSALDVLVQQQIVELLHQLRMELGMTILFVSHNLAVTRRLSDTIAVMKQGRIVEAGDAQRVISNPAHAYTRSLIASVPALRRGSRSNNQTGVNP
jgi:peptide/nickel transport system ATP-binding protein